MKRKKATIIFVVITTLIITIATLGKNNLSSLNVEQLGKQLGLLTLIPTVLSVALAFISHNVLLSLLIGFLSGILILTLSYSNSILEIPLQFINNTVVSLKNILFDIENLEIVLLCLVVGGMIELVRSSGGFEALAIKLTKKINTPRKAGLIGSLLGCIIFFDDYANALIVGPIMKPITDRVKVSREKLSYIVDSTAAPVTGIALISSWVAVEISAINDGLKLVGSNLSGFYLFINSIPFCFYCLFCLSFIFLNSMIGRDFGPMLNAEKRARQGEPVSDQSKKLESKNKSIVQDKMGKRIFVGVGSIVLLVGFAIASFYLNGRQLAIADGALNVNSVFSLQNVMTAISYADTINLVSLSAFIGSIFAIITGCLLKLFNFKDAVKSWFVGAKNLLSTVLMLLLAWCLADTITRLGATYYVVEIISLNVSPILVPVLIFAACCIISCASGSYGCLFVVMPLAIPLAFKIISMGVNINEEVYLLICISSVMAGSIFGDHCSPVTDCTILSASGCGCTTMEHCKTQLPYAIVCAIVSVICGILLSTLGVNVIISLIIGLVIQIMILMFIGKKPI